MNIKTSGSWLIARIIYNLTKESEVSVGLRLSLRVFGLLLYEFSLPSADTTRAVNLSTINQISPSLDKGKWKIMHLKIDHMT